MPEYTRKFEQLLMEYHDIFSLDKNEIGCTDVAEHIIELVDEEPFKERFQQISLPLLDEVWEHLQEMLDGGAILPSQSPWCNAMVLVWKKMGDYGSVSTSSNSTPELRRTLIPYPGCRRSLSPWSEPGSSPQWI